MNSYVFRKSRPSLNDYRSNGSSEASLNTSSSTNTRATLRTAFSRSMTDISHKLKSIKIKDIFRRKSTVSGEDTITKTQSIKKDESKSTLKDDFVITNSDVKAKFVRPSFAFNTNILKKNIQFSEYRNAAREEIVQDPDAPKIFASKKTIKPKTLPPPKPVEIEANLRKKALANLIDGTVFLSQQFSSRYILGDLLGDGAFGFVFTATRISDSIEVAVKFIIKSKISKDSWICVGGEKLPKEIATLQTLNHPNIIKYMEHITENDYILLITELHGTSWDASNLKLDPILNPGLKFKFREKTIEAEGEVIRNRTSCDLFECIDAHTRIPSAKAKFLFAQIVLACEYLQSRNLVHRDIKDENIVVNAKYEIKLIDFGSASQIPTKREDFFTRYNGTPHFASPEIAGGCPYQGPQAEVWTLGVLLYTIIFGENPFQDKSDILAYTGKLHYPRFIEPDLQRLLESMLCINVKTRITLEKIKSHPWCSFQITELQMQSSSEIELSK